MYHDEKIILAFIASLVISIFSTARVIRFSNRLGMGDKPSEERKLHKKQIPNWGGVCVFIATMFAYFSFCDYGAGLRPDKLFSITILLFFIGLKDDLEPIIFSRRFLYEFLCAFFIIYITDIRISRMYGVLYIDELPYWGSFLLTSVFIVACINAYNMIDGIDGLLTSLSLVGSIVLAMIFYDAGEWLWTLLCMSLFGALIGFLFFNWQPARIFIGNGGSMFMGTIFACLSLHVIQLGTVYSAFFTISMPQTIALGIVSLPVCDMIYVFIVRLMKRSSPFKADRSHIHHRLLSLGLQHWHAVLVLVFMYILILYFSYRIQETGGLRSLLFTLGFCLFLELLLELICKLKRLKS